MPSCAFVKCTNNSRTKNKDDGITFHSFPQNKLWRQKWIAITRNQRREPFWTPTHNSRICSVHFNQEDMFTTDKGYRKVSQSALPYFTVPSTSRFSSATSSGIKRARKRSKSEETDTDSSNDSDLERELDEALRDDDDSRESSHQISYTDKRSGHVHEGCYCHGCSNVITGFRYVCVQCKDINLCISCEMAGLHGQHYMLRVPGLRPSEEVSSVLEKIREELFKHDNAVESIQIEIKEEPDPLGIVEKIYIETSMAMDNQPTYEGNRVTSSERATQCTNVQTALHIRNKKSHMEMEEFSNFKDQRAPSYITSKPDLDVQNIKNIFDGVPQVKVEDVVSSEARCEVFVHKDVDPSTSGLITISSDSDTDHCVIFPILGPTFSNFTTAPGTSEMTVRGIPSVDSTEPLEPATLSRPAATSGR